MKRKLSFFIHLFLTVLALGYAAIRFAIGSPAVSQIRLESDFPDPALSAYLLKNAGAAALPQNIVAAFPGIESAAVRDNGNGSATVTIRHKKIVAVWTDGKNFYPLTENGRPIKTPFDKRPAGLTFIGELPAIGPIIKIMPKDIVAKTDRMEWIEGRRWNIRLNGGGEIWLPEEGVAEALSQIRALSVLNKNFSVLDLRDPKRAMVR